MTAIVAGVLALLLLALTEFSFQMEMRAVEEQFWATFRLPDPPPARVSSDRGHEREEAEVLL